MADTGLTGSKKEGCSEKNAVGDRDRGKEFYSGNVPD